MRSGSELKCADSSDRENVIIIVTSRLFTCVLLSNVHVLCVESTLDRIALHWASGQQAVLGGVLGGVICCALL